MVTVETVRGPVGADELKTVLMHEHVFVLDSEMQRNYPELWDEEKVVTEAVEKLNALAAAGVSTIVDPTVVGLGRDVARVARVNAMVGLNIVVATGLYTLADVPLMFRYQGPGTLLGGPEPMVPMFVKDITEGIADTGVRAGVLKCAIEESLTPGVERVMRAVAEAHLATGAPIIVHTSAAHRTGGTLLFRYACGACKFSQLVASAQFRAGLFPRNRPELWPWFFGIVLG